MALGIVVQEALESADRRIDPIDLHAHTELLQIGRSGPASEEAAGA